MNDARPDITEQLVHYVRGETIDEALVVLSRILSERRLRGGAGLIKGGYSCVCFSEAPSRYLGYAILNRAWRGVRYQPVGIQVTKSWLFAQGGRPVIYQPDSEFHDLPVEMRWRHVRYEPDHDPPIDFTWEREWRLSTEALAIDPGVATVVVPGEDLAKELVRRHEWEQDIQRIILENLHGDPWAWAMREEWAWPIVRIDGADLPPRARRPRARKR